MKTSGEIEAAAISLRETAPAPQVYKIEKVIAPVPIGEKLKEIVPKVVINKPSAKKEKEAELALKAKNEKLTISEASTQAFLSKSEKSENAEILEKLPIKVEKSPYENQDNESILDIQKIKSA